MDYFQELCQKNTKFHNHLTVFRTNSCRSPTQKLLLYFKSSIHELLISLENFRIINKRKNIKLDTIFYNNAVQFLSLTHLSIEAMSIEFFFKYSFIAIDWINKLLNNDALIKN